MTTLILVVLVLQVVLSAGVLLRVNQVYRWTVESGVAGGMRDVAVLSDVSADDDPSVGPEDAPVTIVAFTDFTCGACYDSMETLSDVADAYDDQVRIVFRDYPLSGAGGPSFAAAVAAGCADQQGAFLEMHDLLFENMPAFDRGSLRVYASDLGLDMDQFESCLSSQEQEDEVTEDHDDGVAYGVVSTPTFFVNGRRLIGSVSFSVFRQAIDDALAD